VQLIRCRAAPHLYVTSFAWPTQAELTQRDFAAERGEAVVISTGAVDAKEEARSAQDRAAAEARNSHRCAPLHQCPVSVVSAPYLPLRPLRTAAAWEGAVRPAAAAAPRRGAAAEAKLAQYGRALVLGHGGCQHLHHGEWLHAGRRAQPWPWARRLQLPRRPAWREDQSAEAVDAQERAAFVAWRRELAAVEEGERLVLTPFEKNLEVWRQLWRVLERSHVVVQARARGAGGRLRPPRALLCRHRRAHVWQFMYLCRLEQSTSPAGLRQTQSIKCAMRCTPRNCPEAEQLQLKKARQRARVSLGPGRARCWTRATRCAIARPT